MANPYGRSTIVPLTNKSGGSVAAGDLVYIDTANNDAFTTGTTASYTKGIGIAQQTIANTNVGLVLIDGYASLVNVNASVTRGNFLASYSVAKQGTDAGSSRAAGTCGMFLTGGTTPDAIIWQPDLGGAGLSNPMTTKGDVIIADTGGTPTRLAAGATAGMVLTSAGSGAFETFSLPPGYQFDYAEGTGNGAITATTEATAQTVQAGNAVTYDGATKIQIDFYAPFMTPPHDAVGRNMWIDLYDGASSIGFMALFTCLNATVNNYFPTWASRQLTPSNASHTYTIKAHVSAGTGAISGGAGGAAAYMPVFIRITKV